MERKIEFVAYLLLYKSIVGSEQLKETYEDILTYAKDVDKLYIFNFSKNGQSLLFDSLERFDFIEYASPTSNGEAADFKLAMRHAIKIGAKYVTIMQQGYFFEDGGYLQLKRHIIEGDVKDNAAVVSAYPLFTCEEKGNEKLISRPIKGCHLVGTIINVDIYKALDGFDESYYETTFDYDYCLNARQNNYEVILYNNIILRNRNFKQISRRVFGHVVYSYTTDIYKLYYETRGRRYLWDKYQKFDAEYVKLDKKLQAKEWKEMRIIEKGFRDKKEIIQQARMDYRLGRKGKAFEDIKY